jgi:hypothetical protein
MPNQDFDLDVTFYEKSPDLSGLSPAELSIRIANLAAPLQAVAKGVLLEKRTMSDVSQDLGIRQSELVTRLHRAKLAMVESQDQS